METVKGEAMRLANAFGSQNWDDIITNKSLGIALGLGTHLILMHGEPDYHMYLWVMFWILNFFSLSYLLVSTGSVMTTTQAVSHVGSAYATYFAALYTSMLVYRAFFHRLRGFPGPFLARLTKFYNVSAAVPNLRYFEHMDKLHKQYGDYIRVGPRDLSIADVEAVPLVHGATSKCSKGIWYSGGKFIEGSSLHTTRDKREHRERRRIWDRAFNAKSLREYEPRINRHTALLMQRLEERTDQDLRWDQWVNFYSFDVMGDIGFSKSFHMLEEGKEHKLITKLHASMKPLGIFRDITWSMNLMLRLPVLQNELKEFMQWSADVLKERKKKTPNEPDIFSYLLDPDSPDIPLNQHADARLVIVAGSDTTASTLTWLFYELLRDPSQLHKLQRAVDEIAGNKTFLTAEDTTHPKLMPLLDGYLNETLRLHPPVPSGVQRETPPQGIRVGDRYIPGNILIWMPIHTIQRDARYFKDPLKFMPERWLEENQSEWILDKRAFMPFSTGTYKCIGNNLAMMEMRVVTANMLRTFNVRRAEGEDFRKIERETRDCFTLYTGRLNVVLGKRDLAD